MKKKIIDAAIIWVSFLAFLLFYVLQKGKGLEGMEAPFWTWSRAMQYHTDVWLNIAAFACVALLFAGIYYTKKDRSLAALAPRPPELALIGIFFVAWITKACYTTPYSGFQAICHLSPVETLLLFELLAIMAIPCMLFVLAWMRERVASPLMDKIDAGLQGKRFFWVCGALSIIGLGLQFFYAFSRDNFCDEGVTLLFIQHSYAEIAASTAVDVHPPLYYFIAKFVADGLTACFPDLHFIYAAKLASVIPGAILVILCLTFIRREWGRYVGGLGAVAVVCMPNLPAFGLELRMYSWVLLWVTCCWLCTYKIITTNRMRYWLGVAAAGLLGFMTLYTSCIIVAPFFIYLAIWSWRQRCFYKWCIAVMSIVIGCIPWLLSLQHHIHSIIPSQTAWGNRQISVKMLCELVLSPTKDFVTFFIIGAVVLLTICKWRKNKCALETHTLLGVGLPFLYLAIAAAISSSGNSLLNYHTRYLLPTFGCMWLGCLISVDRLKMRNLRLLFTIMIGLVALCEMKAFERIHRRGRDAAEKLYQAYHQHKEAYIVTHAWDLTSYLALSVRELLNAPSVYYVGKVWGPYLKPYCGKELQEISPQQLRQMVEADKPVFYVRHWPTKATKSFQEKIAKAGLQLTAPVTYAYGGGERFPLTLYRVRLKPKPQTPPAGVTRSVIQSNIKD